MDISVVQAVEIAPDPCNPSPCGGNAFCKERNGAGSCACLPEYFGDPYTGCRPECVTNSDCSRDHACINNKCKDPCPGACGLNADCRVVNHAPTCVCLPGYEGNPTLSCRPVFSKLISYFHFMYLLFQFYLLYLISYMYFLYIECILFRSLQR